MSEWPIRAETHEATRADCVLQRLDAGGRQLEDAAIDLFLPTAHRVTDRVRASVSSMLDGVAGAVERDMRSFLAPRLEGHPELVASLSSASVAIALPLLADACSLRHPPLIALALRRAGEFILAQRLAPARAQADRAGDALPVDDGDPDVAAAAAALMIAEARRIDRFGEAALLVDDLDAELAHWLVWQVAAALRRYLCVQHEIDSARADALLVQAADAVFAAHDEGRGLHASAAWLATTLAARDRVDGTLIADLLVAGQATAFTAALASASGLSSGNVWNIVSDPTAGRLALLLRAIGASRDAAATVLLLVMDGRIEAATEIERFDVCRTAEASRAIAPLALPGAYRAAMRALDTALAVAAAEEGP